MISVEIIKFGTQCFASYSGMKDHSNYSDYECKKKVKHVDPGFIYKAPAYLGVPQKNWNSFHFIPNFS